MPKCNDPKTQKKALDAKLDGGLRGMFALPIIVLCLISGGIAFWIMDSILIATILACVASALFFWVFKPTIATPKKSSISASDIAFWLIVLCAVVLTNAIASTFLANSGINWGEEQYRQSFGALMETPGLIALLVACIFGPITEELMFRGILFGWLSKRLPIAAAGAVASLLFGLSHLTVVHLITATTFGLVLCALYARFGRLWLCCAIHCIYNFCIIFLPTWSGVLALAGVCVCGFVLLFGWLAKNDDKMTLSHKPSKIKKLVEETVNKMEEKKQQALTKTENAA